MVAVWVGIAPVEVDDAGLEVEEAIVDEELGQTSLVNVPRRIDLIQAE
jgi:hypothetical protein